MKRLKNIVPLCIAIILIIQSCYPIPSKRKLKGRIVKHFKEEYQVDVKLVELIWALHLDIQSYQYTVSFVDERFVMMTGLYNAKKKYFIPVDVSYALKQKELTSKVKRLIDFQQTVVRANFRVSSTDSIDYSSNSIDSLVRLNGTNSIFNIHVYSFDYKNRTDIDWHKFQPLINFIKQYEGAEFSIALVNYPPDIFNSKDLLANDFRFGYKHYAYVSSFEGKHLDKKLDSFILTNSNLNDIVLAWEKKLLE